MNKLPKFYCVYEFEHREMHRRLSSSKAGWKRTLQGRYLLLPNKERCLLSSSDWTAEGQSTWHPTWVTRAASDVQSTVTMVLQIDPDGTTNKTLYQFIIP